MNRWLSNFFASEIAGGIVMLVATATALITANSALHEPYLAFLHLPVGSIEMHTVINDVLMPVFFLFVGLELKYEMLSGSLSQPRQRILPLVAALGGIVAPALIYLAITAGDPTLQHGWAIPTATDIAFAICIVSLAGKRVPAAAKIFLLAIAIYDDLAAILIIALFYSGGVALAPLAASVGTALCMVGINRSRVATPWLLVPMGLLLGWLLHEAGIHTTVAGMITGLCMPTARLKPMIRRLHPWIVFGILPLFAFASAGVDLRGIDLATLIGPLPLGIALGLVIGKPLGIFMATALAIRLGMAHAPASMRMLFAVSMTAGIGFTMSLFIGQLAFTDAAFHNAVKIGVLGGSVIAALGGLIALRRAAA